VSQDTLEELKPLGDAVEKWLLGSDRKPLNQWLVIPIVLWEFRCHRVAALDYCHPQLYSKSATPSCQTAIRAIAAMIYLQRGETNAARVQFALARDELKSGFQPELLRGSAAAGMWYDWVAGRVLLREASVKLGMPLETQSAQ
jgi:hypothetical protein